jgi:hypothetical protein
MNIDLEPLWRALAPLGKFFKDLFREHHFLTLLCGFFVLLMTISFYRFLKSINPALVGLVMLIMTGILIMHWTVTRTEPDFMTPFIEFLAPFFPSVTPTPKG